jgi:Flp pilus assembly protein TadD
LALVLLVDDFAAAGRSVTAGTGGETAAIAAGGPRKVASRAWPRWLAVTGALGTWLALRRLFSIASISLPPVADLPRDLLSGLAIFLLRAFAPWPPSVSHPYAPSWTLAAAGALALAALLLLAWRRPSLATPVALLLAPLVPAGLAAARLGEAPERYLYLPSLGLAWLAGAGLQAAWERAGAPRAVGAAAAALLIIAGGLGWVARLPDWRSDATLFGAALRVDPGDALANLALGSLAAREGRLEEAGQRLEAALQRDPASVRALATLAWVDLRRGEAGAAAARARQAIALAPAYPLPRLHLSGALHLSGDHVGELAAAETALALSPAYREARLTRSLARCEVTPDPACEADLEAMEREGRLTGVDRLVALAEAALRRRDPGLARARVERLVAAAPADPRSRLLLAALARLEGGAGSRGPPKR